MLRTTNWMKWAHDAIEKERKKSLDMYSEMERMAERIEEARPGEVVEIRMGLHPSDFDIHAAGAKADHGKPRMSLVLGAFNEALMAVAGVGTFGANKYSDNGWKFVGNAEERYMDAAFRHLFATEEFDEESGYHHLAHAAWNILAVLQMKKERDNEAEKEAY